MPDPTTIQVSRDVAESLRRASPGSTYDEIIRRLLLGNLSQEADTRILDFVQSVNPATKAESARQPGVNGLITAALVLFPPGPSGLVEVQVSREAAGGGRDRIIPTREDSIVALDDMVFSATGLSIPIRARDTIRVEWFNYDGGFAHKVPVYVFVTRV